MTETFAGEIYHDVFTKQPIDMIKCEADRSIVGATTETLHYFLFCRTKKLLGANDFLPKRINDMADFLVQGNEVPTETLRDEYLNRLCTAVVYRFQNYDHHHCIINILQGGPAFTHTPSRRPSYISAIDKDITDGDRVSAAAAAVDDIVVFKRLISKLSDADDALQKLLRLAHDLSWEGIFGHPIKVALAFGYDGIISEITEQWKALPLPDDELSKTDAKWENFHGANHYIHSAIQSAQRKDLQELIDVYTHFCGPVPLKCHYEDWIITAAKAGDTQILRIIMDVKTKPKMRMTKSTFEKICNAGYPDFISTIFKKGLVRPKDSYGARDCPLSIAIRCGHLDVIRAVLDNGADVEGPAKYSDIPLNTAVRGCNIDAIELLLERGATVPYHYNDQFTSGDPLGVALRTKVKRVYDIIRNTIIDWEEEKEEYLPEFTEARRMAGI